MSQMLFRHSGMSARKTVLLAMKAVSSNEFWLGNYRRTGMSCKSQPTQIICSPPKLKIVIKERSFKHCTALEYEHKLMSCILSTSIIKKTQTIYFLVEILLGKLWMSHEICTFKRSIIIL